MNKDLDLLDSIFTRIESIEQELDNQTRKMLWERIARDTLQSNHARSLTPHASRRRRLFTAVSAAAAVLILCLAGYFSFHTEPDSPINYDSVAQYFPHEIENIQLVLPDRIVEIRKNPSVIYEPGCVIADGVKYPIAQSDEIHQFIVPFGKTADVQLADGSKVRVNAGSKLIYKSGMGGTRRQVYVNGEVFLDVFHDENRPFTVKTNRLDVRVLGTEFDVRAYDDEEVQSVVLVSGSVSVSADLLDQRYRISPEQCFSYNTSNCDISIRQVPVENYIAWMDGLMILDNAPLKEVFRQINRYYNVEIVYDSSLENVRISGKLDIRSSVEDTLETIGLVAGTQYRFEEGKYCISAR